MPLKPYYNICFVFIWVYYNNNNNNNNKKGGACHEDIFLALIFFHDAKMHFLRNDFLILNLFPCALLKHKAFLGLS